MTNINVSDYEDLFFSTASDHLLAIEQQLKFRSLKKQVDLNEIFRRIHSLKGSASVMKHNNISDLCDEISQLIKRQSKSDLDSQQYDKLFQLVIRLKNELLLGGDKFIKST